MIRKPVMLFRLNRNDTDCMLEYEVAKKHFNVIDHRAEVSQYPGSIVIPRYSALPYYFELEKDCKFFGNNLINSYNEHLWIANFEYYEALKEYTAETWEEWNFNLCKHDGPFVVKGKTNSRKQRWDVDMFASTKRKALEIASNLKQDMLICTQDIIFRKYIPLKTFEIGIHGLPFTNEWRFFYLRNKKIAFGYYWSIAENPSLGIIDQEGLDFADKIAEISAEYTNFFVLDIAEKVDGGWVLIEINDGSMSGLSEIDPETFYCNLAKEMQNVE